MPPGLLELLAAYGIPVPAMAQAGSGAPVAPVAQAPPAAGVAAGVQVAPMGAPVGAPGGAPMAPVVPAAQAAPAAPWGAGDGRGGRGVPDANKAIRRIRGKIDAKSTTGAIYTGVSQEELSIHTSAVLFQDKVSKVLSTTDGGAWALTADSFDAAGSVHYRPPLDKMTPLRRELLQDMIGDHLATYDEMSSGDPVEVPGIDGSFSQVPAADVSVTEWLRKLVREGLQQAGGREAAERALNDITVRDAEAWKAAARRLVVVYRALIADPVLPHISEATFFWRYITEQQLSDLLERLVQMLLPSAFDQNGLQGVVHERLLRIADEVRPLRVDFARPMGEPMRARGVKTESVFGGMVTLLSARSHVYQPAARGGPKGGPTQRFASVGEEAMMKTRHLFRQSRSDIAALLGGTATASSHRDAFAAMGRGEGVFDQWNPAPPASPRDQEYDVSRRQGADALHYGTGGHRSEADQQYPAVAAITNQAASTPGQHGVPFGKDGPLAGPRRPQWVSRGGSQGSNAGGAGSAPPPSLPGLPAVDATRQERAAFLSRHKLCFSLAFQGVCPRQVCSFNHDTSLMPAGYFKAHAGRKRPTPDKSEGGREVSRPKRQLYALSEEQANVVAAFCDEDVEAVDAEGADGLYA